MNQSAHLKWRLALRQVKTEAEAWGHDAVSIQTTLSVCRSFLDANQIDMDSQFNVGMLDRIEVALETLGTANSPYVINSTATDLSSQRSRLRDLLKTCRALMVDDFSKSLRNLLRQSPFTCSEISAQTGIPLLKLKTWLAKNSGFVVDMTAEQAKKLDAALGADRRFFALYAAMTQEFAFREIVPAADQILERIPLGRLLRANRRRASLRISDVVDLLKRDYHLTLAPGRLAAWEQGKSIPCQETLELVAALDSVYRAGGKLFESWLDVNPRKTYSPYALRYNRWPSHVKKQFEKLGNSNAGTATKFQFPRARVKLLARCSKPSPLVNWGKSIAGLASLACLFFVLIASIFMDLY